MTDSVDLKLDRAEHHLHGLTGIISDFSERHAYEVIPTAGTNRKAKFRRFKLHFTEQPSEMVPVILGDIIHNVRSALDHLVVANVPRKRRWSAGFPIFDTSPFDSNGKLLDNKAGEAWATLTQGLAEPLLTQVKLLQPYQTPLDPEVVFHCKRFGIDPMDLHSLRLLSKWDNADKHRELIAVPRGLDRATVTVTIGSHVRREKIGPPGFLEDGALVVEIPVRIIPPGAQVKVEVSGTPRVAIRVGGGVTGLPGTTEKLIVHARGIVDSFRRHGGK